MNWPRDNTGLSAEDLNRVFKYEPREITIVKTLARNKWESEVYTTIDEKQWWTDADIPQVGRNESGLVLLLAKRSGEPSAKIFGKTSATEWVERTRKENPLCVSPRKTNTFAGFEDKKNGQRNEHIAMSNGERSVRTLPFSKEVFKDISDRFHIHGSVARVVSRADVPVFTSDEVEMATGLLTTNQQLIPQNASALVYNCRSSNAWGMDLALTATHYPQASLTFAVLFGCPCHIEFEIISRLSKIRTEAGHPLLLPGIFAEIEATRQVRLVEEMGNEVEATIFALDDASNQIEGPAAEERNRNKRTAYLDLAYLRNGFVGWNRQIEKMIWHSDELLAREDAQLDVSSNWTGADTPINHSPSPQPEQLKINTTTNEAYKNHRENYNHHDQKRITGFRVRSRLIALKDECDDRIRNCTMHVEGMAMATQWAQGETNVEIALATNRDSRHMRSIALVTMIFLPGTFFASMFSMTFFNWSSNGPVVSVYIWIYVLITIFFTALTLGLWYYIVIFRPARLGALKENDMS